MPTNIAVSAMEWIICFKLAFTSKTSVCVCVCGGGWLILWPKEFFFSFFLSFSVLPQNKNFDLKKLKILWECLLLVFISWSQVKTSIIFHQYFLLIYLYGCGFTLISERFLKKKKKVWCNRLVNLVATRFDYCLHYLHVNYCPPSLFLLFALGSSSGDCWSKLQEIFSWALYLIYRGSLFLFCCLC